VAAVLVGTVLGGCSAARTEPAAAAPVSTPAAASAKADALLVAVQGYSDALLTGDVDALPAYLHPDCASPQDQRAVLAPALAAVRQGKEPALRVQTVEMNGDSGRIGHWRLAASAPATAKSRARTAAAEQAEGLPWRYVAGEWQYRPAACGGGS
jgi:hypothetical protein